MTLLEEKDIRSLRRATNYRSIPLVRMKAVKEKKLRYDEDNKLCLPGKVARFAYPLFKGLDREKIVVVDLDAQLIPTAIEVIAIGAANRCIADVANIFKHACLSNASSLVLLHNHPSGNLEPSEEDTELTKNLLKAGEILGIHLQDHIIMGDDQQYFSFREKSNLWD